MIWAICIGIICITALTAQHLQHEHQRTMQAEQSLLHQVERRICELENRKQSQFDPVAFDELKTKVESLRIAQGLKRG